MPTSHEQKDCTISLLGLLAPHFLDSYGICPEVGSYMWWEPLRFSKEACASMLIKQLCGFKMKYSCHFQNTGFKVALRLAA